MGIIQKKIIAYLMCVLLNLWLSLTALAEDYMELPNHARVDLSARCPVCGMIVGGELFAGVTYAYRDEKLVGLRE